MKDAPAAAVYRRVFSSDEGIQVLADLMEQVELWNNGFEQDPRKSDRIAGQRDIVMFILDRAGISDDYRLIAKALFSIPAREPEPEQTHTEEDDRDFT